ncbi:radical SAM protein [Promethearchaeum syntrophicum]|uniref:Radical SAM protein n=1 Tax=Promethearchaeum syntrophicum TaxID=2594042 RepID=A0A5B9D9U9_9ARCH|nr:radical SAM protein [Candidatus Prometheoarchaeum syntrophicum]QEE15520.1 molybdenum cofactor biosynthesis protein A [Candidatus Prometheoarchaeum syntrophicum]
MKESNSDYKIVFGIVPSRRLGQSLGISPIPKKTCNFSCVYCQLGRTTEYTRKRQIYYNVEYIINELKEYLNIIDSSQYDIITIVGDGEPTLYLSLGDLIKRIKKIQDKPVAVISNGSLMADPQIRKELSFADVVLLNFDSWDEQSFRKMNRPLNSVDFISRYKGYIEFRKEFSGIIYLEVMLVRGINDNVESITKIADLIKNIHPNVVFVNVPVRPPAEQWVKIPDEKIVIKAREILDAQRMDYLPTGDFTSIKSNPTKAVLDIIGRHPMREEDIVTFLKGRKSISEIEEVYNEIIKNLKQNPKVQEIAYGTTRFFRIKS